MKQEIRDYIQNMTRSMDFEHASASFTATALGMSRSVVSQYLNAYYSEGKLLKIGVHPVCFFDVEELQNMYEIEQFDREYASKEAFQAMLERRTPQDFDKLIGSHESLNGVVTKCRATISYPPHGLPVLLHGPTGTGKSLIASMMYEYCKNQALIHEDAAFVILNCSEGCKITTILVWLFILYCISAYFGVLGPLPE